MEECKVHLGVATIFINQVRLVLWDSSGITMELNLFHGIQMDCSMESMMSIKYEIGWGLSQHSFHGFHTE